MMGLKIQEPDPHHRIEARQGWAMKIVNLVNLFAITMLVFSLGGAAIAIWTAGRAEFFNQRITLAHNSYERHLQLASNTYQLFKQYGDAMMIGDRDLGSGEAELIGRIRGNISDIRGIIGEEIDLVGEEEIEELEFLSRIEIRIEELIVKFEAIIAGQSLDTPSRTWAMLSTVLDDEIDRDFRTMIDDALEEELEEVSETRQDAMAHTVFANRIAYGFAILAISVTLCALWSYRWQITGPLSHLMSGVRSFAAGRFDTPIEVAVRNEIAEVGQVLDDMATQVEARTRTLTDHNIELERAVRDRTDELQRLLVKAQTSEANRRQLLADVSHELRTPLTIIQGESDIALRGGDKTPQEYRDALSRARDAAAHTARLVDDLLFISRKEAGGARLALQHLDLEVLLADTVAMMHADVPILSDVDTAPTIGDPLRLRQCIIALLQNARHHGGTEIIVRLDHTPAGYRIAVEDDGPGMSDAEKERAFERFFRGPNATANYIEGSGLGLPVVRSIAEAHGGAAWLENRPGGGMIAAIAVPKRPMLKAVS